MEPNSVSFLSESISEFAWVHQIHFRCQSSICCRFVCRKSKSTTSYNKNTARKQLYLGQNEPNFQFSRHKFHNYCSHFYLYTVQIVQIRSINLSFDIPARHCFSLDQSTSAKSPRKL